MANKLNEEEETKAPAGYRLATEADNGAIYRLLAYAEAAKAYIEKQAEYIEQLERSLEDAREEANLLRHKLNV